MSRDILSHFIRVIAERIEVLKGPAAVLFGRIEPGGFINLVTKQPLAEMDVRIPGGR